MSTSAIPVPARHSFPAWRLTAIPLWTWCLVVVAIAAGYDYFSDPGRLARALGDTDDATRLVEVRQLLAGQGWFDLMIPRFGAPEPLVSHWSRLIDAPIAALILIAKPFAGTAGAETFARFVWPPFLLFLTAFGVARATLIRSGRQWPAMLAAAIVVASMAARSFFMPGRIDHHNAMALCGVVGLLSLAEAHASRRAGILAGFLLGLGNAIGYEALFPTGASLAVVALMSAWAERPRPGFTAALAAYALTLAAALIVTTAPASLLVAHCDALSINLVALAVAGAAAMLVLDHFGSSLSRSRRLAVLATCGIIGIGAYVAFNPACMAGPFAEVDPVAMRIWMPFIDEVRSFYSSVRETPVVGVALILLLLYGANASFQLLRQQPDRIVLRLDTVFLLMAIVYALIMVRVLSYASLLVAMPIALTLARPSATPHPVQGARHNVRLAAIAVAICAAVLGAGHLMKRMTGERTVASTIDAQHGCLDRVSSAALAGLPPGLVVNDMDLGPFLLAETAQLSMLSAPYHRIGTSIVAAHDIFFASPAEAARRLAAAGATYVAICPGLGTTVPLRPVAADALKKLLLDGRPPPFLERIALPSNTPIRVYRFDPARSGG